MSVKRSVEFSDKGIGFTVTCKFCPLLPHTEALGQKPKSCIAGIVTNMQGPIPMGTCEHLEKDSIKSENKSLSIICNFPQPLNPQDKEV